MAVVVIGGHTRNIGKTSAVAGLIAALPEQRWTAIKVTQYGHGVCSADGKACDCATDDHTVAVTEERSREGTTDSSRYLLAGAEQSVWVRTRQGQLFEAMPRIRSLIEQSGNVVIESNSILQFLRPDVFLSVLDAGVEDFKGSARRFLDRADAVLWSQEHAGAQAGWCQDLRAVLGRLRVIQFAPPVYFGPEAKALVLDRIRSRAA